MTQELEEVTSLEHTHTHTHTHTHRDTHYSDTAAAGPGTML